MVAQLSDEGKGILETVTSPTEWYDLAQLESRGYSKDKQKSMMGDEHRLVKLSSSNSLMLLGGYILGHGVRNGYIPRPIVAELDERVRLVDPLTLAQVLEISPQALPKEIEFANKDKTAFMRLERLVSTHEEFIVPVEHLGYMKSPAVDWSKTDSLTEEQLVLKYRVSNNAHYVQTLTRKIGNFVEGIVNAKFRPQVELAGFSPLVAAGKTGLNDAINKFDVTKGVKFRTYAARRVMGDIYDYLRSISGESRNVIVAAKEIDRILSESEEGEEINIDELASKLGKSRSTIERALAFSGGKREYSYESNGEKSNGDRISSEESLSLHRARMIDRATPESILASQDLMERVMDGLSPQERQILESYALDGATMKEIGDALGLSESRISQMYSNIKERVKAILVKD